MRMNAKKTKAMVISKQGESPLLKIKVDGAEIEQVKSFIYMYLGHKITEDGRCDEEIKRRIGIARTAFSKMNSILAKPQISLKTRMRILYCCIWPPLLYGAETWTISKPMRDRLIAFEMWCYRKMLMIKWSDRITNVEVLRRINTQKRLYKTIQIRTLKFFGHTIRRDNLQRILLEGKMPARRARGRPRINWTSNISQWTASTTLRQREGC